MSYTRKKTLFEKIKNTKSLKGFAFNFMLPTIAGQKIFLYNEKLPRVINISMNERTCIFACLMCPYAEKNVQDMYRQKQEMSFETLKNIVKSIPNDPYYSFDISSIGETLEFANLAKFIKYMKEQKPLVNTIISTNAALLTEKVFKDLIDSGLDTIQLSLFAPNKELHEQISQRKVYDRVVTNVTNAGKIKKELNVKKPFLQAFMIDTVEANPYIADFEEFWKPHVDKTFIRPMYNVGRDIQNMTPRFEEPDYQKRYPCVQPWYSTAIRSNGDVLACYAFHWYEKEKDSMVIGNINKNTLTEIWNQEMFVKFREDHLNMNLKDHPVCQKCNHWAAYTNIWKEDSKDKWSYDSVKLGDYLKPSEEQRGG